jgi:prepilin-type N-terminal cleavage/methylation domain-containing protein
MSLRLRRTSTRTAPHSPSSGRAGFTLVEVMVASVILSAALLAMAGFTVRYQQVDSNVRLMGKARQAANERLEQVRGMTPYLALDTMAATESSLPNMPGFSRTTVITRIGGGTSDTVDYKIVTVSVQPPGGSNGVKKTTIVGAF